MSASTSEAKHEWAHAMHGGPSPGVFRTLGRLAIKKPVGAVSVIVLVVVVLSAVFAPWIATQPPNETSADILQSPTFAHLLGTDNFGRDMFSRLIFGGRTALEVAAITTAVSVFLWLSLGVTAGYARGAWDYLLGRVIDFTQALPSVVLLVSLLAVAGRSILAIGIALGVISGIVGARVVRSATLVVTAQQYVTVARSIGCSPLRVIVRHVIPNVLPLVIVLATINVGSAIIATASLSFLGFGVRPPTADWGTMLSNQGRVYMLAAPWMFYAPTAALALVVFSVNMLGDVLRDTLDPRLQRG